MGVSGPAGASGRGHEGDAVGADYQPQSRRTSGWNGRALPDGTIRWHRVYGTGKCGPEAMGRLWQGFLRHQLVQRHAEGRRTKNMDGMDEQLAVCQRRAHGAVAGGAIDSEDVDFAEGRRRDADGAGTGAGIAELARKAVSPQGRVARPRQRKTRA